MGVAISSMWEIIVLGVIFLSCTAIVFVLARILMPVLFVRRKLTELTRDYDADGSLQHLTQELQGSQSRLRNSVHVYFESLETGDENAIKRRLVRAGFFSKNAIIYYFVIRITLAASLFVASFFLIQKLIPDASTFSVFVASFITGSLGMILPNFALDRFATKQEERYRRAFPEFMDMMVVCTDAGLSLESAANRVSQEFLKTHPVLGVHLCIMMLEVRAGKRLREALANMAERLHITEARSLATLFRQSEELGTSLTQALRVYSDEMRKLRLLRAEEKANALPVKMVLPLAAFLFPVTMALVVVPVLISLVKILGESIPGQ